MSLPLAHMSNALRLLSVDMVERAQSGHPGLPLGAADVLTALFACFLKYDPSEPLWPNRDRFILSAGHGSAILYALYHCLGIKALSTQALQSFRQLHSITPGHPEHGATPAVEMTTGPLGQGLGASVGMALGEKLLRQEFGPELVNHYTYVLASDGDLMEGVSHEAASLAGHLGLGKLIVLYDSNRISIDGPLHLSDETNTLARFRSAGWNALEADGHNHEAICAALAQARQSEQPSLIMCHTHIGLGAPTKQDCASSHGAPLGVKEVEGVRAHFNWPHPPFHVPEPVQEAWHAISVPHRQARQDWEHHLATLPKSEQKRFHDRLANAVPVEAIQALESLKTQQPEAALSTRKASGLILARIQPLLPALVGGSADLSESTCVKMPHKDVPFIHYGIREHGMAACMNGLALHGGFIPFGSTFLVFSDYLRPALRLCALMKKQAIYIMTHDSIGLGEDGPTHQPVEHLAALRCMPNVFVFRPADKVEVIECWQAALSIKDAPSVLVLSRQDVPAIPRMGSLAAQACGQGAYEIIPASHSQQARVTLLATGSEVALAQQAQKVLEGGGLPTRVVSMPCWALFDQLSISQQEAVLGMNTLRVGVEAACRFGWERYITNTNCFIGMNTFGASGKAADLYVHFSITSQHIVQVVKKELKLL